MLLAHFWHPHLLKAQLTNHNKECLQKQDYTFMFTYASVVALGLMHSYIQSYLLVRAVEVMYISGKINISY